MCSADSQPSLIKSTVSYIATEAGYIQANHLWIINDFGRIHVDRGVILSSVFFSADDVFEWELLLNPNGNSCKRDSSCISLGFKMFGRTIIDCDHFPVTGKFKVSIMNAENQTANTKSMNFTKSRYESYRDSTATFLKFVEKDYLFAAKNKLLSKDRLTISCEIIYFAQSNIVHAAGKSFSYSPSLEEHQPTGLEDFEKLLKDEKFADVTLLVNGEKYRAHKAILAARSPVFNNILEAGMIENNTIQIETNDVDKSVFIEMLRYIYTGKPQNLKKTVTGLLEAADKYDLKQLRVICVKELIKNLSKDNVKDILLLADKYNSKDLKTAAMQFSKVNFLEIDGTNESSADENDTNESSADENGTNESSADENGTNESSADKMPEEEGPKEGPEVEKQGYVASWLLRVLGYACVFVILVLFLFIFCDSVWYYVEL